MAGHYRHGRTRTSNPETADEANQDFVRDRKRPVVFTPDAYRDLWWEWIVSGPVTANEQVSLDYGKVRIVAEAVPWPPGMSTRSRIS